MFKHIIYIMIFIKNDTYCRRIKTLIKLNAFVCSIRWRFSQATYQLVPKQLKVIKSQLELTLIFMGKIYKNSLLDIIVCCLDKVSLVKCRLDTRKRFL
jgi:hypothetical protein